jgi:glycosyltransferase involved in cell wall biosynthesis
MDQLCEPQMEPRMKVLKCILDSRFGGPHRRSFAIARRLRERGVETIFLFGDRGTRLEGLDDFEHHYVGHLQFMTRKHPLVNLLLFVCFLPLNVLRIRKLIKSRRVGLVDVDGVTNTVPALAGRLSGVPVLWCYNDHPPALVRGFLLPWLGWLATRVVVQGERLRQLRTGSRPKLHAKTTVLYPGIDTGTFDPGRYGPPVRRRLREQWGIPPECPLVGVIGNVNRLKGHMYFIEAAGQIKRRSAEARFVIVGRRIDSDPGYWESLQDLTARLGLSRDLIFTDYQEDIPAVLSTLDVFVLSSVLESCPNVVLEAMAMKVPVVATDVGAVGELLGGGAVGVLVAPRDARAIAEAVLTCLTEPPGTVQAATDAARKRVETLFGVDRIARLQLELYEVLAEHRQVSGVFGPH